MGIIIVLHDCESFISLPSAVEACFSAHGMWQGVRFKMSFSSQILNLMCFYNMILHVVNLVQSPFDKI